PNLCDVFLSFREEDSGAKFIPHLYSSLQNAGIYAFRDNDKIQRGDQISMSLLRAIQQSKIAIVILSTNYANSRCCLHELERIMKIGRTRDLVVVPVYEVDRFDVRHQKSLFGNFFEDLISTSSVGEFNKRKWRNALIDIAGIAGFSHKDSRLFEFSLRNTTSLTNY
ncbi:TMV resistance protein N, partial [Trifolium medium]|nr:TMV resistance protein N [Trifolium medium]